jgi:hypothetical protein
MGIKFVNLRHRPQSLLALLAVLFSFLTVPEAAAELLDQYGVPDSLEARGEQVRVVIVVSAKRLRRLKPWEEALWNEYPDLPIVRVADIPRTAPTSYDDVAAKLRKRLPEDVSVLIDLDGVWAERYGLDVSVPNLLIFAPDGTLVATHAGMYSRKRFDALDADLRRVLEPQTP